MNAFTEWIARQKDLIFLEAIKRRIMHQPDIAHQRPMIDGRVYVKELTFQMLRNALLPRLISGEL